jgi:hypothetical protein
MAAKQAEERPSSGHMRHQGNHRSSGGRLPYHRAAAATCGEQGWHPGRVPLPAMTCLTVLQQRAPVHSEQVGWTAQFERDMTLVVVEC